MIKYVCVCKLTCFKIINSGPKLRFMVNCPMNANLAMVLSFPFMIFVTFLGYEENSLLLDFFNRV